jgi:hypothetical protein
MAWRCPAHAEPVEEEGSKRTMSGIAPSRTGAIEPSLPADGMVRLATYTTADATEREIIARPGAGASTLVVDRTLVGGMDGRLVGHLAPDEPPENARILCQLYLEWPERGRCRRLTEEDMCGVRCGP